MFLVLGFILFGSSINLFAMEPVESIEKHEEIFIPGLFYQKLKASNVLKKYIDGSEKFDSKKSVSLMQTMYAILNLFYNASSGEATEAFAMAVDDLENGGTEALKAADNSSLGKAVTIVATLFKDYPEARIAANKATSNFLNEAQLKIKSVTRAKAFEHHKKLNNNKLAIFTFERAHDEALKYIDENFDDILEKAFQAALEHYQRDSKVVFEPNSWLLNTQVLFEALDPDVGQYISAWLAIMNTIITNRGEEITCFCYGSKA